MSLGSWNINVVTGGMPEKVATAVSALSETLVGAEYTPIAYLGSQQVNGVNHAVLAEQLVLSGKDSKNIVLLIFNEKGNECNLVNVERVLESGLPIGGITINVETEINEEAQELFDKAFEGFVGADYNVFALLGTQVVHGTNYFFACEAKGLYPAECNNVLLVTVNDETLEMQYTDLLKSNIETKALESLKQGLRISAPWIIFYKEVLELFKKDPEIKVLFNEEEPELKLWVKGDDSKAAALARFMPTEVAFGNVILNISVVGDDGQPVPDINCTDQEAIDLAFKGNGAVAKIKHATSMFGEPLTYVLFEREVVQFYADNMTDLYGAITTIYQDIADEIFEETLAGTGNCFFNTIAENSLGYAFTWLDNPNAPLGKPLGEWP